jgi:hypothetical protein
MIVALTSVELPAFGRVEFYEPLAPILFLFAAREDETVRLSAGKQC